MNGAIDNYQQAVAIFDGYVAKIKDWNAPTPDDEWSVRDLVNHVTAEDLWVKELVEGKTVEEVGNRLDGDILGDDPAATWKQASQEAVEVFASAPLDFKVSLSRGPVPVEVYAEEMFGDHLIHAWDLAKAIGADTKLPDELVRAGYDFFQREAEKWRAGGAFKEAVKLPDNASLQNKLLALTGRNPDWQVRPS